MSFKITETTRARLFCVFVALSVWESNGCDTCLATRRKERCVNCINEQENSEKKNLQDKLEGVQECVLAAINQAMYPDEPVQKPAGPCDKKMVATLATIIRSLFSNVIVIGKLLHTIFCRK